MSYKIPFVIVILLSLFACKQDIDITAPQLVLSDYSFTPVEASICGSTDPNVFILRSSETFSFKAFFQDDVALSQYKIDIHQNFDCHGHGEGASPGVTLPTVPNQTTDWALIEIGELEGTEVEKEFQLQVPENVTAGNYHFSVQVIDLAGNSLDEFDIFSLKIFNIRDTIPPVIEVLEPVESNLMIARGSSLVLKGQVSDNYSFSEGGNGVVFLSYINLNTGNLFATNVYEIFTSDELIQDFELEYLIPQTLTRGNYRFILGAFDGVRNTAEAKNFLVEVF